MLALIIIIIIDLLVVIALFVFGTRGSHDHEVSLASPAIKAMSGTAGEVHPPAAPDAESAQEQPSGQT